ncbi:tRNA 2-thiouridine(34) synthase MnmA [Peptostreptococcaceae bacterium AGR-M142]
MVLNKNKVAVGISGGVDSFVCAYLLKEKGFEVVGVTMILNDIKDVADKNYIDDAKKIANILNIKHYILDLRNDFKEKVIKEFVGDYLNGKTPNPCVLCNKYIKYDKLLNFVKEEIGAYYLALGHYVNLFFDKERNIYKVKIGKDKRKDQTYMLSSLNQEKLKHLKFPLYNFNSKEEVRKIASNLDLEISRKKDSQGICFIDGDYKDYINKFKIEKKGNFLDLDGNILKKHDGFYNYTIGQRVLRHMNQKLYVLNIDEKTNDIIVAKDDKIYFEGFYSETYNFLNDENHFDKILKVKVCQWGYYLDCRIIKINKKQIKIEFLKKERAVSKGQWGIFYLENELLGGAKIESVY